MTTYKKATLVFLFFINLGTILYFWWIGSGSLVTSGNGSQMTIAFGRLFGLIAQYLILVQLILMGRITWIEQLWGHGRLNDFHRWNGYTLSVFLLLHPILLINGYSKASGVSPQEQMIDFLTNWEGVYKALWGLIFFIIAIVVSLPIIRKNVKYETWYFPHLLLYFSILFVFPHQYQTADVSSGAAFYYWSILWGTVFGIMLLFRFGKPFHKFWKHRFYIDRVEEETPTVNSIYIKGQKLNEFNYRAGQSANFNFLQKGLWYTHPFSFSTAKNNEYIRISAKKSGDMTSYLGNLKNGTKVIIDGPLGIFTERGIKRAKMKDKILFIAGGIGITPIRALIEELSQKNKDMVLLYSNKNQSDVPFGPELIEYNCKIHFIFSDEKVSGYEFDRIDEEKIIRLVPDYAEREIFVCGPPQMMDSMISIFEKSGVPKKQVHFEKFF